LDDHVELVGTVDDARLRELYRAAWVFVLTPVNSGVAFEGFGLTYLEAGAYGLPVIGSRGCGAEDAILDGETGFLVPQESPTEVAARLRALLLDPVLARSLGAKGREHTQLFGWERVAESYLDVYLSALAR
jgi:glycosyltransferase involved in cell wall biosynthesis